MKEPTVICRYDEEGETAEKILTEAFSRYLLRLLREETAEGDELWK